MKKLSIIVVFCLSFTSLWLAPANVAAQSFFKTHGFVFFFASTCPYCHQFSPVLKKLADDLHAEVLPLSFDNQPLPEFKNILPATSDWVTVAFQKEQIHYPALFIANPRTHALFPVSIGALSEIELNARIDALIPKIMAYENKGAAL